jgi:hypothetical protein
MSTPLVSPADRPVDPRSLVCVTGMHRSGTSLATRALEVLGMSLGAPERLLPPGPDNPAGYFENKAIQELDDELLAQLGGSWDQPPTLVDGWADDPGLDPFRSRAAAVLHRDFGPVDPGRAERLIGFKDPRVALLLPFWRTVVSVRTTVVVVRAPAEVAASLARRNGIEVPQSALLWLRYVLAAAGNDPGHLLIGQDDFFEQLGPTLLRLADHLGLPRPTPAVEAEVAAHLDVDLQHGATADVGDWGANPVANLADQVWNAGRPDLDALGPVLTRALVEGWLRPPVESQALARARAEAVSFKEQLKRRNEVVRALKEGRPPAADPETPVIDAGAGADVGAREPA